MVSDTQNEDRLHQPKNNRAPVEVITNHTML